MSTNMRQVFFVLPLLAASCSSSNPDAGGSTPRAAMALPDGTHVGTQMQTKTPLHFAIVDAEPAKFFDQTLLVEATVSAVCQTKGCWMKIEDQGHIAMVRWESGCGGKFAFPKDAAGKRVLLQGSFYAKTISEADAKHLEEEAVKGTVIPRQTHEFNVNAVRVLEPAK